MRRMRMTLAAAVLVFALSAGSVEADGMDVRFDASINTPGMSVRIGNMPHGRYYQARRRPLPARRIQQVRLDRIDWRIADRMAWYTGVPERRLIRLRRMGYSWGEIGRWLGMSRPAIRATRHMKSWKRYIREERMYARNGGRAHKQHKKIKKEYRGR